MRNDFSKKVWNDRKREEAQQRFRDNLHYGEFEVGNSVTIERLYQERADFYTTKKITVSIEKMTEKAILLTGNGNTAWFPKSVLKVLPTFQKIENGVVCSVARWFKLSPDQMQLLQ